MDQVISLISYTFCNWFSYSFFLRLFICLQKWNKFWIYTLYWMYLSVVECFGEVLWSFMYRVKPSANKHALTSSFSICILLVYFTCLAKTSSAILNDESGNLCLVSDFSVNAFSFSQFTMLLSVSTCILPLLSWSVSSYPYFFQDIYH